MSDIVKVNLKGIDWDIDGCEDYEQDCEKDSYWVEHKEEWCKEAGLPTNIDNFIVGKSDDYDPYEKWTEDNRQTGWEMLEEDLAEELSTEYGFCINGVDEVEIVE